MSTVTTSEGWMTSFIYEQDLTSAYMNGVLYSMFRPGIYNANFILQAGKYSDSSSAENDGLSLLIKKGTTFVFSNDYLNLYAQSSTHESGKTLYRRSFTNNVPEDTVNSGNGTLVGNRYPVVIKCVAMRDLLVQGISQSGEPSGGADKSCAPWEGEYKCPKNLYLCAIMKYDQNGTKKDYPSFPSFQIFRNNPYYGTGTEEDEEDPDKYNFFYFNTKNGSTSYSEEGLWRLPDGSSSYGGIKAGTSLMTQFSYLMIGVLSDVDDNISSYEYFTPSWFQNHTFTARCLPEYRNNMIGSSNNPYPDFLIPYTYSKDAESTEADHFGRLYVDFKNVTSFGNIYNTSIDWEPGFEIAKTSADADAAGYFGFSELSGTENVDYISYELSKGKEDEENEKGEEGEEDKITSEDNKVSLVVDFTFAVTKNVTNALSNLNGGEDVLDSSSFISGNTSNKLSLINHREIIDIDTSSSIGSSIVSAIRINDTTTTSSTEISQIKLDICSNNSDRLLSIFKNNDLLYRIMGKMRANGELDPIKGESLIPVAVAFRLLKKDFEGNISNLTGDNITSEKRVNPLNVLGLLDLEYKMTKLSPINTRTQNAYSILPVID